MLQRTLAVLAAALLLATVAVAGPKQSGNAPKVVDVNVCPIKMEPVKGAGGGTSTVGKYRVHFCCPGCKPAFDKLSKAEKQKKIALALKKQKAAH